ncbi:MAG: hypothetical protein WD607_01955 [Candidatus Paceibacterota bacterium]
MGGYSKKDAAKDTKVSVKEVSKAHHEARQDAEKDPDVNFKRGGKNKGPLFKKKK